MVSVCANATRCCGASVCVDDDDASLLRGAVLLLCGAASVCVEDVASFLCGGASVCVDDVNSNLRAVWVDDVLNGVLASLLTSSLTSELVSSPPALSRMISSLIFSFEALNCCSSICM